MEDLLKYDPKKDPYLKGSTLLETANDLDDFLIKNTDLVILAGVSEDEEVSHLDVYVFESAEVSLLLFPFSYLQENAYIHHDYLLPSFPLSMAWLNYPVGGDNPEGKANMVAIGTFEPYIEIWDLDIVDCPSPAAILGGPEDLDQLGSHGNIKLVKGMDFSVSY